MSECMIVRRGGKAKDAFAYIAVNYPVGATCIATNGVRTLTAKDTSGKFVFDIPNSGTFPQSWTVTESANNNSKTVLVSGEHAWVTVDLVDTYEKLVTDIGQTDFARLSHSINDSMRYAGSNDRGYVRQSSEPIIFMYSNSATTANIDIGWISLKPILGQGAYKGPAPSNMSIHSHYTPKGTQYYSYITDTTAASGDYYILINGAISLSGTNYADNSNPANICYKTYLEYNTGEIKGQNVSDVEDWIDRLATLQTEEESFVLYNGESTSNKISIGSTQQTTVASRYNSEKGGFALDTSALANNPAVTNDTYDISEYKTLRVIHEDTVTGTSNAFGIGVSSTKAWAGRVAFVNVNIVAGIKQIVDVPLAGVDQELYAIVTTGGSNNISYISRIELIK